MQYYKVLYKFDSEEAGELSVLAGDVVRTENFVDEKGWVFMELASNPRKKGVVPTNYLKAIPNPNAGGQGTASSSRSTSPANQGGPSYTSAVLAQGEALRSHADDTTTMRPAPAAGGGLKPSSKLNPAQVVEGFMRNEVFFKQLMKQREDSMNKIETALNEAQADLAACKDKNAQLTRKLKSMDQDMTKERQKWRERVEEERLLLAQRVGPASAGTVTTTTTTLTRTTPMHRNTNQFDSRDSY